MNEPYKRFMVFEMDVYYPCGGTLDCRQSFDTEIEAIKYAKQSDYDETEIFDRIKGKDITT